MLPDLSVSIARMDRDDLADTLPDALWRAPAGTERRDWADTLMGQVIAAQEAHERAATVE